MTAVALERDEEDVLTVRVGLAADGVVAAAVTFDFDVKLPELLLLLLDMLVGDDTVGNMAPALISLGDEDVAIFSLLVVLVLVLVVAAVRMVQVKE